MTEKEIKIEKSLDLAQMVLKALSSKIQNKETHEQEEKEGVKTIVKEGNLDIVKEIFWMLTSRPTAETLWADNCAIFALTTANRHGEILKIIVEGQKKNLNQRMMELLEDFISNELEKEKNGAYHKNREINRIECLKMLLSVSPAFMELRFSKSDIGENMKECVFVKL